MTTTAAPVTERTQWALARGLAVFRIFTGIIFLSNGLAKAFDTSNFDWGFISFNLITRGTAQQIATRAADRTTIAPLGDFYHNVVLANWGVFGTLLMIGELAIGIGLIFGIASRLAALGGLLFLTPTWIMLWPTNGYLWEYPNEIAPLLVFTIVPAGRVFGLDGTLAARLTARWPF